MIATLVFLLLGFQGSSPEALQHMQAGAAAEKNGHFDVAISEFRQATELEPTAASGFVSLGQAYLEKGDYGHAIAPLKQALKLSPDLNAAHQLLGYALLAQGYAAEAVPRWESHSWRRGKFRPRLPTCRLRWRSGRMIRTCCTTLAGPAGCSRSNPSTH